MKKSISILAVALAFGLTSCDDLFVPAQENNQGINQMYKNPQYSEGVLANAYTRIPIGSYPFSEVATDDAVSNDDGNSWRKIASGTWSSSNNPTERWQNCRAAIQYINLFLDNAPMVLWDPDPIVAQMFMDREMAEAYALRAMYMYYLLEAHAGYNNSGELLGVPIITEAEDGGSNFNVARNSFTECVEAMKEDAAKALAVLPLKYGDEAEMSRIQQRYEGSTMQMARRVFGDNFIGRIDGHIVEAFIAKMDLLGASPSFNKDSGVTWADAAASAATVLNRIGGVDGLDPTGNTWYCNTKDIDNLKMADLPKEILWAGERGKGNSLESDNFPPSLYGNGRINPTQNFVDCFGDADGYPIASSSLYRKDAPYAQRDPRLDLYVVYNGQRMGNQGTLITTASTGTNNDALNKLNGKSTRTGYYMRKLLRQDVSMDPVASMEQYHYTPRIRYTEMFLAYAEAANEAYGPTQAAPGANYSAYDVIKAIRNRGKVGQIAGDKYLESIKGDKDKMRELIRNERRIELSFEGHRFWDLRRWNVDLSKLNEDARGMNITTDNTGDHYEEFTVDNRQYRDYMYYGPIPYTEVLKFSALDQNKGW